MTTQPATWTADPDAIIEKVRRGKQALESLRSLRRRRSRDGDREKTA